MTTKRTPVDYLNDARALCRKNRLVWFVSSSRFDYKTRKAVVVYRIYRHGMGLVAERSTPAGLVAYLKKQLPPGSS